VNLPTSVKQGRQLLDQIYVPHISFKKSPIMIYKEETYYLHHRPIFDAIKELLSNKEILDNCTFDFKPLYNEGQRIYYEQYNGNW
jgi:replicative DNA helicase